MNRIVVSVCLIYFATMIVIGIVASRRNRRTSDYLVAGRRLGTLLTGLSLAAVQIGVGIVLGSTQNGFQEGLWPGTYYALGCGGGLMVAGLLTAGPLRRCEGYVPIDFFARRFGERRMVRLWAWMSNIPSMLGIFVAQLLAAASILSGFGIPVPVGLLLTAGVMLVYSALGGMWGIVLTDVVQTFIIMVGIPVLAWALHGRLSEAGVSFADLGRLPFIPEGMSGRFVYLTLPFLLSISVSYDAYTRIQSARNVRAARWGCVLGGCIVLAVGFLCAYVGTGARQLFPELTEGVFTLTATRVLPPVWAGVVTAAILAAAMSSGSCVLLSLGASFSRDFYNKFLHPEVDDLDALPHARLISRITVVAATLLGIFFALHLTDILDAMIIFNYPYMGSLLIPLLGGLLWQRATLRGALWAAVTGGVVGVVAFLCGIPGPLQGVLGVDFALLLAYAVSGIALVVGSLNDSARYTINP